MRNPFWFIPLFAAISLGLAFSTPPAFADTLSPVTGSITVTTMPGGTKTAILPPGPDSVASVTNAFQYQAGQAVGVGDIGSLGPLVVVQGEISGVTGLSADAMVSYYAQANSLGVVPCAGGCEVPVTFQFQLQATSSASGSLAGSDAVASTFFNANGAAAASVLGGSESMQCVPGGAGPNCTSSSTTPMTQGFALVNASGLSDPILIQLLVGGSAGGLCGGPKPLPGCSGASKGSFLAIADPIVQISDELIAGTNINYRDAFALSFSSGVVQGVGQTPEPGTIGLMLAGIGLLSVMLKRIA